MFLRLVLNNFRRSWYISMERPPASNKGSLPNEFISDFIFESDNGAFVLLQWISVHSYVTPTYLPNRTGGTKEATSTTVLTADGRAVKREEASESCLMVCRNTTVLTWRKVIIAVIYVVDCFRNFKL
jgi:hypothetical protein